mmetsp:Transcript_86004/g.256553  ORF Transcript_86004/g.256553 Transcript_86004/m.256553 type:complete len:396 (+) Transcript_86004:1-1188(+)
MFRAELHGAARRGVHRGAAQRTSASPPQQDVCHERVVIGAARSFAPDGGGGRGEGRGVAPLCEDVVKPDAGLECGPIGVAIALESAEGVLEGDGQLPPPVEGPDPLTSVEPGGPPILERIEVAHDDCGGLWPLRLCRQMLRKGHGVLQMDILVPAAERMRPVDKELPAAGPVLQERPTQAPLIAHVQHAVAEGLPEVRVVENVTVPRLLLEVATAAEDVVPLCLPAHLLEDPGLAIPLPELRDNGDVGTYVCKRGGDSVDPLRKLQLLVVDVEGRQPRGHVHPRGGRPRRRLGLRPWPIWAVVLARATAALGRGAVPLLQQHQVRLAAARLAASPGGGGGRCGAGSGTHGAALCKSALAPGQRQQHEHGSAPADASGLHSRLRAAGWWGQRGRTL